MVAVVEEGTRPVRRIVTVVQSIVTFPVASTLNFVKVAAKPPELSILPDFHPDAEG
jgi:hypothetical protein